MAFFSTKYDVYFFLGDPQAEPIWNWAIWEQFLIAFDPLVKEAHDKPGVRSSQYLPNQGGAVKFGRIGWNEAGHHKWTHGSPTNKAESKTWAFGSQEIWAPSWTTCEREDRAPDLFMAMANEGLSGGYSQKLLFNPIVILALELEFARLHHSLVRNAVATLSDLMSPKLAGYQHRPWGIPFGKGGFTNALQDLAVSGLFKPGPRHQGQIGFPLLAETWQSISAKNF